jgi:hypothetical protein
MLASACGRSKLNREKISRALRIGADFAEPVSNGKKANTAHAEYARHGKLPWDLIYLESQGANLACVDSLGNNAAHIAFDAGNMPLCKWLASHRMDLCLAPNHAGHTAFDMLFGEFGNFNLEPDESRAFREAAFSWLAFAELANCKTTAWRRAIELLPSRSYRYNLDEHFAWFDDFAAEPPERQSFEALLGALDIDEDILREAKRLLEPRFAMAERHALLNETHSSTSRRARPGL